MFLKKFSILAILLICISIALKAQEKKHYSENWKKVAAFEKKGLPKSALQEVQKIYSLALNDNNEVQQIRSSMYQIRYRNMIGEDSDIRSYFLVDSLASAARVPAKNIFQTMQAEILWRYLQRNRYKFYDRTALTQQKGKDISTWSLEKLHTTIAGLYQASLQNKTIIKNTPLAPYDPIIEKGENTRQLRPTLFDFLAHRALDYFMNDEQYILKPAYRFAIREPAAFAPHTKFIQASFTTRDTVSLQYKATKLLQELIEFHLADTAKKALLDADLIRLDFMYQHSIHENKTRLYESALKEIEDMYSGTPEVAQAMYLRARVYFNKGLNFIPIVKTENQYELRRAKELCEEVIRKFPNTEGAVNCKNLSNQILIPSLNLETEKVNLPDLPFRTLVKYKNAPVIYFRVIKTNSEDLQKTDRGNNDNYWKSLLSLTPLRAWKENLPNPEDFQEHSVEVKIEKLPVGVYYILASLDKDFSLQKNILARQRVYTSNIGYVQNNHDNYYVLHRESGLPLPNTHIQVWESKYSYSLSRNDLTKAEQYTTDKSGYFKLKESKEYRSILFQMKHKEDELFLDEHNYSHYSDAYKEAYKPFTFLFTDRSIYRPGQTLYFKGIVVKKEEQPEKSAVMANTRITLQLKDANGQKINSLQLTTNNYGSYHGAFKLPEGVMNGQFSLYDETTNASLFFQVEEYKRPKFQVEISKPSGTFRLGDSIPVTGTAKAYTGNAVNGAALKYRVVRKTIYQPWWMGGYTTKIWPPGPPVDEMEITNGETITDQDGNFQIRFKAIPDEQVDKSSQPVFHYEVSADVTDIDGETRSASTSIAVAYQAVRVHIELANKINVDSLKTLKITTLNTNDIFEKSRVHLTIQKLQAPGKIYKERYWQTPDQFIMSRDEYSGVFPFDIYKDEHLPAQWPVIEKLYDKTDSSRENGYWPMPDLSPGWYKIEAATLDKYGEKVRAEKFVLLQSDTRSKGDVTIGEPAEVIIQNNDQQPGGKIKYTIKPGFENTWLIHSLGKMDKSVKTSCENIQKDSPFQNEIALTENDRGGLEMTYVFVRNNRVYKGSALFRVPWENKELKIIYETFRDKILPGSGEKWTAKITGNKGERIAAELLVSMYDASLDQFKPHQWNPLNIWPSLSTRTNWSERGFNAVHSEEYNRIVYDFVRSESKRYDRLLSVFLDFGNDRILAMGGRGEHRVRSQVQEEDMIASAPMDQGSMEKKAQEGDIVGNTKKDSGLTGDTAFQKSMAPPTPGNNIRIRKDFRETAFFFPDLLTDSAGNISFSFSAPDALTEWKLLTMAHSRQMASGYSEKTVITQKPLMIQPNIPRFLREGDRMVLAAKVVNLSQHEISGRASLELLDAATNLPVDSLLQNILRSQPFTVKAGQSVLIPFPVTIPAHFPSPLAYRFIARSEGKSAGELAGFSDGEESAIPVLTNRLLVTESLPLYLRNSNKKEFKFEKLLNSGKSKTLAHHAITVEYSTNPLWYAVQALPYLMENPCECVDQTFNRFYANSLAFHISNQLPRIKSIFEKWEIEDTSSLMSNLQKNEELKMVLLQETPWVLDAVNEQQQKKNIALLFDMVRMRNESGKTMAKLIASQSPNGGFVWFKGGPDDRYMTQYILTGIGHLQKLKAVPGNESVSMKKITDKGLAYLDNKIREDYDLLVKNKVKLGNNHLGHFQIQYLYMRSFFNDSPIPATSQKAYTYFQGQAKKYWTVSNKYMQAMIALALFQSHEEIIPKAIIRSLKESAIVKEGLGMYWKEWTTGGYYWHQAPIESQALMIEAFSEIDKNPHIVNNLKQWLLMQKQTQNWKTTRATAEACYALLINSGSLLKEETNVVLQLGKTRVSSTEDSSSAGTGYFTRRIESDKIHPEMGNISVEVQPKQPGDNRNTTLSWGAMYWQYFEDLDKITPASTPLKLEKKVYLQKNTDKGQVLQPLEDGVTLQVGDKVIVRIELRSDRDLEYVHMKDMRAASMEPVNVISGYKYQGGLGYYESTKDASTNFFFPWLPKGTYVFEYPLFGTHSGNFSNGITSIQCLYAPEFTSQSEGIRLTVLPKKLEGSQF